MARKKYAFAQINMRIREDLRRKLEQRGKHHHTSLMNVIRLALEDSFNVQAFRDLDRVAADLKIHSARLSQSLSLHVLEDQLAEAIEQGDDAKVRALLKEWLLRRREHKRSPLEEPQS